ncbi:MAG: 16S rRNA (guanine1516-N2)-methyltransferase [Flavobacterium sp.]|jgi:16S rRNA (guanine1516-N2)-methyltransferase
MARFRLINDEQGYALSDELSTQLPLRIDFLSGPIHYRRTKGGKKELLIKAINVKEGCHVWDCTAGLGKDSFLLAAKGCRVTLFERSTVLSLLLDQALKNASTDKELGEIVERMRLVKQDSIGALENMANNPDKPDVILIDPMFPTRRKSAQVRGEMQTLQKFLGKDGDASSLVKAALATSCPRVVVKRPADGGQLENLRPTYSIVAKANRFDIFLNSSGVEK